MFPDRSRILREIMSVRGMCLRVMPLHQKRYSRDMSSGSATTLQSAAISSDQAHAQLAHPAKLPRARHAGCGRMRCDVGWWQVGEAVRAEARGAAETAIRVPDGIAHQQGPCVPGSGRPARVSTSTSSMRAASTTAGSGGGNPGGGMASITPRSWHKRRGPDHCDGHRSTRAGYRDGRHGTHRFPPARGPVLH